MNGVHLAICTIFIIDTAVFQKAFVADAAAFREKHAAQFFTIAMFAFNTDVFKIRNKYCHFNHLPEIGRAHV